MTAIVDLDGTLMRCNTFTEFVKFLFRRFPRLRVPLAWIVGIRKLRLISHIAAKRRIVKLAEKKGKLTQRDIDDFIDTLLPRINAEVDAMSRQASTRLLVTAAPSIYAERLGLRLGFDRVFSTPPDGPEMRGERKVEALECAGIPFDADTLLFTDHRDDLPLLHRNRLGRSYLVTQTAICDC